MRRFVRGVAVAFLLALGAAPAPGKAASSLFVYVHDRGSTDRVFGFSLDTAAGSLDPLPGSPFAGPADGGGDCGGYCNTLAFSKKRKMLFSGHREGVTAWRVGEDGALTLVEGSPFGTETNWGVAVVEKGKRVFVYSGLEQSDMMAGYEVQADGTLVAIPGASVAAGDGPLGVRAFKNRVVVRNESDATVSSYVAGADGSLTETPGSPFSTAPVFGWSVDLDPRGRFAFVSDESSAAVHVLAVDGRSAALSEAAGSPVTAPFTDCGGGTAVSKKLAVVGGYDGATVQVYSLGKDGSLAPLGEPQALGPNVGLRGHAFDAGGRNLVVAFDSSVRVYAVDPDTGELDEYDNATIPGQSVNDLVIVKP